MQELFGVSKDNWKKQKNKFLEHFGRYYEYEIIYSGRNIKYKINKVLANFELIKKKGEKRDEIYEKGILQVIAEDNYQTAANVARLLETEDREVQSLGHTTGTIYEYTRVKMRNMFGTVVNAGGTQGMIIKKVWCFLNIEYNYYEEMSEESIAEFFEFYDEAKSQNKEYELEVFSDYQSGLISKDEMNRLIGEGAFDCYRNARTRFAKKHGYYPIKVPVYELSAFKTEEPFEW